MMESLKAAMAIRDWRLSRLGVQMNLNDRRNGKLTACEATKHANVLDCGLKGSLHRDWSIWNLSRTMMGLIAFPPLYES